MMVKFIILGLSTIIFVVVWCDIVVAKPHKHHESHKKGCRSKSAGGKSSHDGSHASDSDKAAPDGSSNGGLSGSSSLNGDPDNPEGGAPGGSPQGTFNFPSTKDDQIDPPPPPEGSSVIGTFNPEKGPGSPMPVDDVELGPAVGEVLTPPSKQIERDPPELPVVDERGSLVPTSQAAKLPAEEDYADD